MKTWLGIGMVGALGIFMMGCDRPEIPRDEYGTVIEEFPDLPNAPKTLPIPDDVLSTED